MLFDLTATVDKATEVRILLKQKEAKVQELEYLLSEEKTKSIEQIKIRTNQFHEDIKNLKLKSQIELNEKKAHLERAMAELQSQPQLEQFIKEALDVNNMLKKEQEIFCHQASMVDSYFDSNKIMIQQIEI